MIQEATYTNGSRTATIKVDRLDTWLAEAESVINFPGLLELDGDRLFLTASRSRHGAEGTHQEDPSRAFISEDVGQTWAEAPPNSPLRLSLSSPRTGWMVENFDSGVFGHLRDGSIGRIDHWTQSWHDQDWSAAEGSSHEHTQEEDPTFRWHRWQRDGTPIEHFTFKVAGIPWRQASYQSYATLLDLANGDLLAALEWASILPEDQWTVDGRGRTNKFLSFGHLTVARPGISSRRLTHRS